MNKHELKEEKGEAHEIHENTRKKKEMTTKRDERRRKKKETFVLGFVLLSGLRK
jgi:hypothetical protein